MSGSILIAILSAHFNLESLLGTWKVYSAAVNPSGKKVTPFPDRFVQTIMNENDWRDGPGMNSFIVKVSRL